MQIKIKTVYHVYIIKNLKYREKQSFNNYIMIIFSNVTALWTDENGFWKSRTNKGIFNYVKNINVKVFYMIKVNKTIVLENVLNTVNISVFNITIVIQLRSKS